MMWFCLGFLITVQHGESIMFSLEAIYLAVYMAVCYYNDVDGHVNYEVLQQRAL